LVFSLCSCEPRVSFDCSNFPTGIVGERELIDRTIDIHPANLFVFHFSCSDRSLESVLFGFTFEYCLTVWVVNVLNEVLHFISPWGSLPRFGFGLSRQTSGSHPTDDQVTQGKRHKVSIIFCFPEMFVFRPQFPWLRTHHFEIDFLEQVLSNSNRLTHIAGW
jgi:hypothetical protein